MKKQTIHKVTLRLQDQSKPELASWLTTYGSWLLEALGFKQGEEVHVIIGERLLILECEAVAQELAQNLKTLSSAIHDITGN